MRPICKQCHSPEVFCDAYADWGQENQKWELCSTYDNYWCTECDGETTLIWEAEG